MGEIERLDPPRQLGNVTLLAVLGEGGMATVYLASIGTGAAARLVAVKLLRPGLPDHDYRTRFKDEAKLVLRLHHPNIVEVREAGDLHEQLFIVMALVEGRDLADIWDRCAAVGKAFPVPLAVHIIREILRGLHYAHTFPGLGLVHRDVSPSNILIDWTGVVRLADFGLATSTLKGSLTVPGVVFGKVGYMSPEQARHETLDGRADVYACGAVLWELLTGRPLRGGDGVDTEDVSNFMAPPPSSYSSRVDAELDAIVSKALARDREDRYLSAHDFMEALGAWLARRGIVGSAGTEQMAEFLAMLFGDAAVREREGRDSLLVDVNHAAEVHAPRRSEEANKDTLGDHFAEEEEFDLSLSDEEEDDDGDRANMKIIPLPERPDRLERGASEKAAAQARRPRPKDELGLFGDNPQNDVEHIEAGTIIADRYRVVSRIGRGGMGTVYLGEHTTVGRRVAIKVLTHQWSRSELVAKRFRAEARAASAAGHPNIIEVFDAGQLPDGRLYLVMEYLTGRNLYDEIQELGTLPVGRACRIIRAVARAIRAAHDVGIIHRDLKPDNVMFVPLPEGEGETVKVLDFGISAGAERTEAEARLTVPGHALGTPEYMAPEQAKGKDATELFDIYALGVMLYECLVGEPPFVSNNLVEIMARKSTEKAPSLGKHRPDLPKGLVVIVDGCLEMNPGERPQSAREFLQRLEEVIRGLPQDAEGNDIAPDGSMVGIPIGPSVALSGPNRKPGDKSGPGPVPLPHTVQPVTQGYENQRKLIGIGVISVAAAALLYIAFSGGPTEDDPTKLVNATTATTATPNPPDPIKTVTPAKTDPTKIDPTKIDPTKIDPTKIDPTKIDPTKIDPTKVDPTKDPEPIKKGGNDPSPRKDPSSEQCKSLRDKVTAARNGGNFHDMLRLLNDKDCWKSKAEHGKLRTLAYKELGKFKECAKAGKGNTDPDVVKWVNLCEKRSQSG